MSGKLKCESSYSLVRVCLSDTIASYANSKCECQCQFIHLQAGAFAIFPFLPKLHFQFPFHPFPSSFFPFLFLSLPLPLPSTFRLRFKISLFAFIPLFICLFGGGGGGGRCEHVHNAIVTRHIERSCCQCKAALNPTVYQCNAPASLPILYDCVRDSEWVHDPSRFREVSIHLCEKKVTLQCISHFFFFLQIAHQGHSSFLVRLSYQVRHAVSDVKAVPSTQVQLVITTTAILTAIFSKVALRNTWPAGSQWFARQVSWHVYAFSINSNPSLLLQP